MAADQKLNIKLVNEVKNYPFIYNYTLPEYARRDVTEKAWVEIGQKVQLSGPECKEKWKNLRSVFARRLKRRRAGKTEKKPYYLEKYMQFTLPFLKMNVVSEYLPLQQPENIMSDSDPETKSNTDDDDEALSSIRFHSILLPNPSPNSQYILPSDPSPNSSNQNSQSFESSEGMLLKKALQQKSGDIITDKKLLKPNRDKRKYKANQLERQSSKMFLLSLLADMDAMDDKQRRYFKQKMLELVEDIFNTQKPED